MAASGSNIYGNFNTAVISWQTLHQCNRSIRVFVSRNQELRQLQHRSTSPVKHDKNDYFPATQARSRDTSSMHKLFSKQTPLHYARC